MSESLTLSRNCEKRLSVIFKVRMPADRLTLAFLKSARYRLYATTLHQFFIADKLHLSERETRFGLSFNN